MMKSIIKKEFKELLKSKEFIVYYIIVTLVVGIMIPLSAKESLLYSQWYISAFIFVIIAAVVPSGLTADSFAGEKERKTIETLICSPISLSKIYIGKVIYITIVTYIILTIGFISNLIVLVCINFFESNTIYFAYYPFKSIYVIFINTFFICLFITILGTLVSLKCERVKGANLINYFIGLPISAPMLAKLYTGNIEWTYILIYNLIILIGIIISMYFVFKKFNKYIISN